jgi:hypothetical protein
LTILRRYRLVAFIGFFFSNKSMPLFVFFLISVVWAGPEFGAKEEMNHISFKTYREFPQRWKLVTIRFRKDTGEMRLTYANELAYKTLAEGAINYPDGAVFGKLGINSGADPQFTSSIVPSGIRRFQIMVKDKKKYPSTNGWGYALFDPDGKTFPEDPVATQNACYACHTIVENRGDVFSQPLHLTNLINLPVTLHKEKSPPGLPFRWLPVKELPSTLRQSLPTATKQVRWLEHEQLRAHVFQGTLDELRPALEQDARRHQAPSVFLSKDGKRYIMVIPTRADECMEQAAIEVISTDINLQKVIQRYCTHD